MYPGGGVICHKIDANEVMELHEAIKALDRQRPVCVPIEQVFLIRYIKQMPNFTRRSLVAKELASLMLGDREDLDGRAD